MSKSNAASVHEFVAAVGRRDIPGALALLDPGVEWVAPASLPYGGRYSGPEEVATRYFPGFFEHVDDDFELLADEVTEADDRVVVRGRLRGHGRLSGTAFELPLVQLWSLRDGKATRLEYHTDTAVLLAAVEARPVACGD